MKKLFLTIVLAYGAFFSKAQTNQWHTTGDSISDSNFIGSTNLKDFIVKTNSQIHTIFDKSGAIKVAQFQGLNNRIVFADLNGVLNVMPQGNANQVLFGNGTWGNLPNGASLWQQNGSGVFYDQGYVGIGTQFPVFQLDVAGDARISNNLYVGGGIVISDKMRANIDIKTRLMEADSIKMGIDKVIYGETKVDGDIKAKHKLEVDGEAKFNGNLISATGFTFDGNNGLSYSTDLNGKGTFSYGNNTILRPPVVPCAAGPQSWANHQMGGMLQIYDPNFPTQSGLLNFQTWYDVQNNRGASSIDASIAGTTATGGLLLNFFCGNNTFINTNNGLPNRGGNIYMGERVSMAKNVGIGNPYSNDNFEDATALNIFANENNQTAIKINSYNGTVKAIDLVNTDNTPYFTVWQNGKTFINGDVTIKDLSLQGTRSVLVDNNGKLVVGTTTTQTTTNWALGGNAISNSTVEYIGTLNQKDLNINTFNIPRIVVKENGWIGINTTTPTGIFEIRDQTGATITFSGNSWGDWYSSSSFRPHFAVGKDFSIYEGEPALSTTVRCFWIKDGKTHIGEGLPTPATTHQNAMLTVGGNGKIACKELYVIKPDNWADYVFENNYKLLSLKEVEAYYTKNKHLPGVPSGKELDETGISTAEMDATLLKKIEELTLYVVELQKKVEALEKEKGNK